MTSEILRPILITTPHYSIGFPSEQIESYISRDAYIAHIYDFLQNGTDILFLEGEEGAGKTAILAQYATINHENTVSVFFNTLNNTDYNLSFYCSNLVYQFRHLLGQSINLEETETISPELYYSYIFQIRKKILKQKKKITIIVDGLENRFGEKNEKIREIIELLPIGHESFNLVITGNEIAFKETYLKSKPLTVKTLTVTGFSEPEIEAFLALKISDKSKTNALFKITKGFPGRLKTLKRLLETSNYSIDNITNSTSYKNWVELDCESIDYTSSTRQAVLSLLSLEDNLYTIGEIGDILNIDLDTVSIIQKEISLLEVIGEKIQFISPEYKRFFSNRLRPNSKQIKEYLIRYHSNRQNPKSLIELPKLYSQKQDWQKVVSLIDDQYSTQIINSTESLKEISENLALGIQASENLKQFTEMYRFSLEGSMINELNNFSYGSSEAKARIALEDFSGAISLAESAILKIDRLRLFASIARKQKEAKQKVDEDLVQTIQELYNNSDFSSAGDKLYDIVADLIYAIPNLAIEMIEKASDSSSDKGINDWIIAKLSIAAINSSINSKEDPEKSKTIAAIEKLDTSKAIKINKSVSLLVGRFTGERVLEEIKKLTDSTERLRLFRLWLTNHRHDDEHLGTVISYALNELVSSSSKTLLTQDILKELSDQLPYVKDNKLKDQLYYKFREIENNMPSAGLTRNKISLRLNLFHTEFTIDAINSEYLLKKIIHDIQNFNDTLIKLESFSEVYSKLADLSTNTPLSSQLQKVLNFSYKMVLELSDHVFDSTANHYYLSKHAIKKIAKRNPNLSLKICSKINLQIKRENSRVDILDAYLENTISSLSFKFIDKIEESFEFEKTREYLCTAIIEKFSQEKRLTDDQILKILPYIKRISIIKDPANKAFSYANAYQCLSLNEKYKLRISEQLKKDIIESWQKVESDWEKIDAGFLLCAELSQIDKTLATNIFKSTTQLKENSWIDSSPVAETYVTSLRVVIRSVIGLISINEFEANDLQIIKELLGRLPSEISRLDLWTEIGISVYLANDLTLAKKIHTEHIVPLLDGIIQKGLAIDSCIHSLTYTYLFHQDLANDYIKKLNPDVQERVYDIICDLLLTSMNPFETYDGTTRITKCDFDGISKAINLLNNINTDYLIFWQTETITKAIQENKDSISRTQINQLTNQLSEIIEKKLPDRRNIKHDGYKILATAKVAKLKRDIVNPIDFWLDILESADKISNISDKILIKSVLLEDIPFEKLQNFDREKSKLYQEIIQLLESISSNYEFVQRVTDISELMYNANKTRWKELIKKAFTICNNLDKESETFKQQKSLIDTSYRLDTSFAQELVKFTTEESSNFKFSEALSKHYDHLKMIEKIKNDKTLEEKEKENNRAIVRAVISSLKSINSNKTVPKKIAEASLYLQLGTKLPLREAFPIYMYYLTNCAKTYKTKQAKGSISNLHRENFKKAVKATNLIQLLSYRRKGHEKGIRSFFVEERFSESIMISPGSREDGLNFIRNWMSDELNNFIIIVDPYFSKTDLDILKIITEIDKTVEVFILACKNGHLPNVEEEYKSHWKKISDQYPPYTRVVYCWLPENINDLPIHDRWLLTENSGISLGTSLNGIGKKRESGMSIMTEKESKIAKSETIDEYLDMKKRSLNGVRISYKSFTL